MKLKKITKLLPPWEEVRIWGRNEDIPLYDGPVEDIPYFLLTLKLEKSEETNSYMDIRYNTFDKEGKPFKNHIAVFVEEE